VSRRILWVLLGVLTGSCGDDQRPDTTPPGVVSDLRVAAADDSVVSLSWTAPENPGEHIAPIRYDLRYSTLPVDENWKTAVSVDALPQPGPAGLAQAAKVTGLEPDTNYSFALCCRDLSGNWSDLSNVVWAGVGDPSPPARVTDLAVKGLEPRAVTLTFIAPGDDDDRGRVAAYEVRFAPTPVTEATWEAATPLTVPGKTKPSGQRESVRVYGLEPERTFHLALRARDDAGKAGEVSNDVTVVMLVDTVPPGAVTSVKVQGLKFNAVVTWTASGNDGKEGRASGYRVRYAEEAITEVGWETAHEVAQSLAPAPPGTNEELAVAGLSGNRNLWFAVRAVDERGNMGPVSKEAYGFVRAEPRTWSVNPDGNGDATTVQGGIDIASPGDMVLVHPGTYYEHIDYKGKAISLKSAAGADQTILDGSRDPGTVVTFAAGETREAVLDGFTVQGGTGFPVGTVSALGGGIRVFNASPTIRGNVIRRNRTTLSNGAGGGMAIYMEHNERNPVITPRVEGNRFEENEATVEGGALVLGESAAEIVGNVFIRNHAPYGGAIHAGGATGSLSLVDNEFVENRADGLGGALYLNLSQSSRMWPGKIERNLFLRNEAKGANQSNDIGTGAAIAAKPYTGTIRNNTFAGNVGTGTWGEGGTILINWTNFLWNWFGEITIEDNIFFDSKGAAINCRDNATDITLTGNLFWGNTPEDARDDGKNCLLVWRQWNVFDDPLFCDPAHDDYHVRSDSPALAEGRRIGAFLTPGCQP